MDAPDALRALRSVGARVPPAPAVIVQLERSVARREALAPALHTRVAFRNPPVLIVLTLAPEERKLDRRCGFVMTAVACAALDRLDRRFTVAEAFAVPWASPTAKIRACMELRTDVLLEKVLRSRTDAELAPTALEVIVVRSRSPVIVLSENAVMLPKLDRNRTAAVSDAAAAAVMVALRRGAAVREAAADAEKEDRRCGLVIVQVADPVAMPVAWMTARRL